MVWSDNRQCDRRWEMEREVVTVNDIRIKSIDVVVD